MVNWPVGRRHVSRTGVNPAFLDRPALDCCRYLWMPSTERSFEMNPATDRVPRDCC